MGVIRGCRRECLVLLNYFEFLYLGLIIQHTGFLSATIVISVHSKYSDQSDKSGAMLDTTVTPIVILYVMFYCTVGSSTLQLSFMFC